MSKLFFSGEPTEIDRRKLDERFGVPTDGTEITHEQIESVLDLSRRTSRYRTVVAAWRKALETNHNVFVGSLPGVGYRAFDAKERIDFAIRGVKQGMRKVMRSVRVSDRTVTEDKRLLSKQDALRSGGLALATEATKTIRLITPPKPQEQMPRIAPGLEGSP